MAFTGSATNLVPGDTNSAFDVFVHDFQTGATTRVSVDSSGAQSNGQSYARGISPDGRFVVFDSTATNLVVGDTNSEPDVFVHDRQTGSTIRASLGNGGVESNGYCAGGSITSDSRYVAFVSGGSNLVAGDTNATDDVFVRDTVAGTTVRASVSTGGSEASDQSFYPWIAANGRYVVFSSLAANLVVGDTNATEDVFVRDLQVGITELVSQSTGGVIGNQRSGWPQILDRISADGRYVAFQSFATNLVTGDTNGAYDIFLRDRQAGTTERVSLTWSGAEANAGSEFLAVSDDGRYVAFDSTASNLVPKDTGGWRDVFLRDRTGGSSFMTLCDPGTGSVMACPCGNPPSGPPRGCDNSSGTGGAILTAAGGTYLSSDSLWFTTNGERPTALSIVTQWAASNPTGAVFGMGVRCTSGTFKRLYTKQASGGSITAPDFTAGDPQVSVRSASLGDVILAGQSRWHFVYYRDPNVLGGCPASSTFNCTQTGQVTWSP
jgi:Tol biopolymer transport system component